MQIWKCSNVIVSGVAALWYLHKILQKHISHCNLGKIWVTNDDEAKAAKDR